MFSFPMVDGIKNWAPCFFTCFYNVMVAPNVKPLTWAAILNGSVAENILRFREQNLQSMPNCDLLCAEILKT